MQEQVQEMPEKHLGYLDSARSIAAMMVMTYHYLTWTEYANMMRSKVGCVLFNGVDAVAFFFVLSGFVLSYKYIVLGHKLDIKKFYINRLFRLWPAFFITSIAIVLKVHFEGLNEFSLTDTLFRNKTKLWEELFLPRSHPVYYLPAWSLVLELSLSFLLPFFLVIAQRDRKLVPWLLFAIFIVGNSMQDLFKFQFHFVLGLLISCYFFEIRGESFKNTLWYKYRVPILLLCCVLFSLRQIDKIYPLNATYTYVTEYLGITLFHYSAIAAFVFIAAMIHSKRAKKVLEHKALLFLGKISYGIYLAHWIIFTDFFRYWKRIMPLPPQNNLAYLTVFLIYATCTIIIAIIIHYTIELPFIRMGKRITAKMKPGYEL